MREASARIGLDPEGRIVFKVGGPGSIPYPDQFFDLLVAVDAAPRPGETRRVLRPGGYLILARSGPGGADRGFRARLQDWRLGRRGIEPVESAAAGDGSFSVARLRGDDRADVAE